MSTHGVGQSCCWKSHRPDALTLLGKFERSLCKTPPVRAAKVSRPPQDLGSVEEVASFYALCETVEQIPYLMNDGCEICVALECHANRAGARAVTHMRGTSCTAHEARWNSMYTHCAHSARSASAEPSVIVSPSKLRHMAIPVQNGSQNAVRMPVSIHAEQRS